MDTPWARSQRFYDHRLRDLVRKDIVESSEYRHVPTGRLSILAQRLGRVFAAPRTWYRLIRERGWS